MTENRKKTVSKEDVDAAVARLAERAKKELPATDRKKLDHHLKKGSPSTEFHHK